MQKQILWATLVLCAALPLSACEEVESCEPGSDGCIDGPPKDGKCKFGLVPKGSKCVEPGSGGSNNGSDVDSGPKPDATVDAAPMSDWSRLFRSV